MKKYLLFIILLTSIIGCKTARELPTVSEVDLGKYAGKWYEIARLPNRFEKGLKCVTATYRVLDNKEIEVINKGITENGELKKSKGKAWVPNLDYPGRLKVRFFWPFSGDYYIMALDKNYEYVLIGNPTRNYLWVLSRTITIDKTIYSNLLTIAKNQGFDINEMMIIEQNCKN